MLLLAFWWLPYFIWRNDNRKRKLAGTLLFWVNIPFYYFMAAPAFFEQPRLKSSVAVSVSWLGVLLLGYGLMVTLLMVIQRLRAGKPGYDPNKLLDRGIFAWIRHPQISGAWFISLGTACYYAAVYHLLITIFYAIILLVHVWMEEHFLLAPLFGENYQEYRRRTKALIPFII